MAGGQLPTMTRTFEECWGSLAAELRLKILGYALAFPGPIKAGLKDELVPYFSNKFADSEIAKEAFYSNNEFSVGPPEVARTRKELRRSRSPTFVIPPERYWRFIRRLKIYIYAHRVHWSALERFSNVFNTSFTQVQELTVNLDSYVNYVPMFSTVKYHRQMITFCVPRLQVILVDHPHDDPILGLSYQSWYSNPIKHRRYILRRFIIVKDIEDIQEDGVTLSDRLSKDNYFISKSPYLPHYGRRVLEL